MGFLSDIEKSVSTEKTDMLSSFWGKMRGNAVKIAFLMEFLKNPIY